MRKIILFFFFLLFYNIECVSAVNQVELLKLTDRIYIVKDSFYVPENSVVYIGKKEVTVISATWSPETAELLAKKILQLTNKPITKVINTHHHLDRVGGNIYFKENGVKILASIRTTELMKKKWISMLKSFQKHYPSYKSIPLVLPDITFNDKYEIENGKIQVLYYGPSHTEDGVVVYFPEEKILFGDCILKEKLGNLDDANLVEYSKTLRKIKKLAIKTIIAGHWKPIHGPDLIDQVLELLENKKHKLK